MKTLVVFWMACCCLFALPAAAQDSLSVAYVKTAADKWQLIDPEGKVLISDLFEQDSLAVFSCSEGMVITEKNGLYGYRQLFSDLQIRQQFDSVTAFHKGRAAVKKQGKWQLIDTSGRTITAVLSDKDRDQWLHPAENSSHCAYGYCLTETDSFINCTTPEGRLMLTKSDEFVAPWNDVHSFITDRILKFKIMANKVCSCEKRTSYYGFIDRRGNWVIGPAYEMADIFSCGLAAVSEGTEGIYTFGYIDNKGDWKILPVYKEAGRFIRISRGY